MLLEKGKQKWYYQNSRRCGGHMQPRKLLRYEPKIVVRFAYINVGKNDFNFVSKSQIILGGGGWSGDGMVSVGGFSGRCFVR